MEIKYLQGFVLMLVFVGMLLGIGVLVIDKFGRATRDTVEITESGKNLSTGSALTLGQTYCLSLVSLDNGTTTFSLDTNNLTFTDADSCAISYSTVSTCNNPRCNITYKYGRVTSAATSMLNVNSAITPIASTWLTLIVTVAVLSIILGLVISSFAGGGVGRA